VYLGAPYGVYKTSDGYIAVAMTPVKQLGELIGCQALTVYDDPSAWFRERATIKTVLAGQLATRSTDHWLSILEPADVWCAEVFTWPELVQQEGFEALELTQAIQDNGHGSMLTTRCPIRVDGQILTSNRGAPTLGSDTEQIIRKYALDSTD
jgi:crotonobetainyl-CoA:carnitine CoA-transferase CaiB-like acyl-CoA transferase